MTGFQPGYYGGGPQPKRGIFISYRRGETSGQARAVQERLAGRFGRAQVFMDVDSILPGADFVAKIQEAIDTCAVVLALIGRDWALTTSMQDARVPPVNDYVFTELETAIAKGVPIIPILVERTPMPEESTLPGALQALARRNALELENSRWEYDVGRLTTAVESFMQAPAQRPPPPPPSPGPVVLPNVAIPAPQTNLYPAPAPWPASRPPNPLATAAGILGIVSIFLLLPSPVAIILGIISLRRSRRLNGSGRGMALAGIICGGVGAAFLVVVGVVYSIQPPPY